VLRRCKIRTWQTRIVSAVEDVIRMIRIREERPSGESSALPDGTCARLIAIGHWWDLPKATSICKCVPFIFMGHGSGVQARTVDGENLKIASVKFPTSL